MIDKELIENAIAEALKTGGDFAEIFVEDKRSSSAYFDCLLYTSPSPRDRSISRMPSSA